MRDFVDFLKRLRADDKPVALATVIDTSGSTYSKSGTRLLIDAEGRYLQLDFGRLSGALCAAAVPSPVLCYAAHK